MRIAVLFIVFVAAPISVHFVAAQHANPLNDAPSVRAVILYGGEGNQAFQVEPGASSVRSIPLALGLSALLPGLGQAYNRQWIKAVAGVAIEAALVAGYFHYRGRGRDDEAAYQAYAHAHWVPTKYAIWLQDYSDWLPLTQRHDFDVPFDIDFSRPDSWTVDDRSRVRAFFNDIRAVEGVIYHPETSAAFSHKLPYFGEQQYYELVGKYFQFAPGWVDYAGVDCIPGDEGCTFPWLDSEGNYIDAVMDPERTGAGGSKPNVQGRMLEYARNHESANDLLRTASRVTSFILLNHIVAAIDAAVFAKLHNDRVSANVSATLDQFGEVAPSAYVRFSF